MSSRLTVAPPAPKTLSSAGRLEWRRMASLAIRSTTVTAGDLPALALLCEALGAERMLREVVEREGPTMRTAIGGRKAHPALRAAAEARAQAMRLLVQFNLTPHAKEQSRPTHMREPENPFARLRRGQRARGGAHE